MARHKTKSRQKRDKACHLNSFDKSVIDSLTAKTINNLTPNYQKELNTMRTFAILSQVARIANAVEDFEEIEEKAFTQGKTQKQTYRTAQTALLRESRLVDITETAKDKLAEITYTDWEGAEMVEGDCYLDILNQAVFKDNHNERAGLLRKAVYEKMQSKGLYGEYSLTIERARRTLEKGTADAEILKQIAVCLDKGYYATLEKVMSGVHKEHYTQEESK